MKTLLLGVFLLLIAQFAIGGEVTIMAGVSQFNHQPDGIWYQAPYTHTLKMDSSSFAIRYDTDQNSSGWSIGAGYMNLGHASSTALATASDADYQSSSCNGHACWPMSHWYGNGNVQGIFAAVAKHYGPWSAEFGAWLYKPTWTMHIPDWRPCATCAIVDLTVIHDSRLQIGPMAGIRYQFGNWSANLSAWQASCRGDQWPAIYKSVAYNFTIGYSIQ